MLYALVGLIIGIILGMVLPFDIAPEYSRYTAVAILAILDSIMGAIRAQVKGEYNTGNFVTGLIFYGILSAFFVYLGDKLNLDLYLGVIVVFMFRIMQNIGVIRRYYFGQYFREEDRNTDDKNN